MQLRTSSASPTTRPISDDGTSFSGMASTATWVDIDNDGDLDLFLLSSSLKLFRNELKQSSSGRKANFVAQTGAQAGSLVADSGTPIAAAWGDFDRDGDMDCFVGTVNNEADRLYVNDGNGIFQTSTLFDSFNTIWSTNAVAWGDFNGDG